MKKFAKIVGIMALIFSVLGLALIMIGGFGGGIGLVKTMAEEGKLSFGPEDFEWTKMLNGTQITIGADSVEFDRDYEIYSAGSRHFVQSGQSVDSFELNLAGGTVNLLEGEDENWDILIEGLGKFQVYEEAGTLFINASQKAVSSAVGKVTIVLPREVKLKRAEFNLGAGEMEVEYLETDTMEINAGAANVVMENILTGGLEISVGAGAVEIEEGCIGNLEVSVGMGEADISADISGNIDGAVSMGALYMDVHGSKQEEHNYEVSCGMGEIQIGKSSYAGLNNIQEINNNAATTYTLDCSMGSIEIKFH